MTINKTISERRKSLGITQKELAEKIGVRNATISDFENGKYNLGSDKLESILEALNLSIHPVTADAGGKKEKENNLQDVD